MTREAARSLLGLGHSPSEAEIQRAFREKAKAAHPDQGGSGGDLGQLSEARDVLLSPPARPGPEPTPTAGARTAPPVGGTVPVDPMPIDDLDRRAGCGMAGVLSIIAIGGIGIVFAVILVLGFVTSGNRTETRPAPEPTPPAECVRIAAGFEDVSCDDPDAQRIELTYDLTATTAACPPGTNTLDTRTSRWCLRPVTP